VVEVLVANSSRTYLLKEFYGSFVMSKLRTCAAVLILFGPVLTTQTMVASAQASRQPRKVVVKKEGWLIPGRDDFKRLSKVVEKNIEGVAVTHKIYEAPDEIIVDAEGRRVKTLFVRRRSDVRLHAVRRFSAYEADGRVFAYEVGLVPVFTTKGKNYWEKSYAGAMYILFYVDEDGDGVYESRFSGWPLRELPEWVRRNV
jgi:hypothetical protein